MPHDSVSGRPAARRILRAQILAVQTSNSLPADAAAGHSIRHSVLVQMHEPRAAGGGSSEWTARLSEHFWHATYAAFVRDPGVQFESRATEHLICIYPGGWHRISSLPYTTSGGEEWSLESGAGERTWMGPGTDPARGWPLRASLQIRIFSIQPGPPPELERSVSPDAEGARFQGGTCMPLDTHERFERSITLVGGWRCVWRKTRILGTPGCATPPHPPCSQPLYEIRLLPEHGSVPDATALERTIHTLSTCLAPTQAAISSKLLRDSDEWLMNAHLSGSDEAPPLHWWH